MSLGKRLRQARIARGLDQPALATLSGVDQRIVSALELRDSKRTEFLFVLAEALSIDPRWLQTGEGDMEITEQRSLAPEAFLIGLAWQHLNQELKDQYASRMLGTALNFVPAAHPGYKRMAALYRVVSKRDIMRGDLKGKSTP